MVRWSNTTVRSHAAKETQVIPYNQYLQSIMVGNHGYDDDHYKNSISIDLTNYAQESDSSTYIRYQILSSQAIQRQHKKDKSVWQYHIKGKYISHNYSKPFNNFMRLTLQCLQALILNFISYEERRWTILVSRTIKYYLST